VLNAGGLDLTFGSGGKFIPDPDTPPGFIIPTDLAVQPDGKLLYLGIGFNDVAPVVRLNANGTVDTSFGESGNGLARSGYGLYQSDGVGLAVGPQGKIAVVGFAAPFHFEDTPQSTLVLYDSNGLLDNSFNGTGTLVARQYPRGFQDVAFQSDGKIVVVGTEKLLRYNANGTPDASFGGGDGIVDYSGKKVLVDTSGKIVVLGFNAVYRFNANGTLDSSFSGDGVIGSVHGSDIAFAPDGDVLLLGNGAHNEYLTRFNAADGSLDTAFGNATPGNTYVPGAHSLAVNGNDIFVGNTFTSTAATLDDLEIRAYTLAGKVDATFGNGGRVQTDVNGASKDELVALAVQQGKLVALAETDAPLPPPAGSVRLSAVLRYDTDATQPGGQTPFSGTPVALPGTINAADFDKGGEGVAYHDTDAANVGGAYRTGEGVDIQNKTAGGPYLGFVKAGEWVEYTVDIPTAGSYDIFVGTAHLGNGGTFHLELDGARMTDQLTVRHGRDWQDFASVGQNSITLPAGRHVLRLSFDTNGSYGYVGNFLNLVFRNHVGPARSPFLGQPYRDGERVESENYDTGGESVTYHDTDAANLGGPYRQGEGVDLQPTTDAGDGFNVGFLKPGEWQEYTVDFTQTGPFNLNVRLASLRSGGSFRVLVDGVTVAIFDVTDTGGWQTYRTLSKGGVNVSQGLHVVRFQMDKANSTGYVVNLNWFEFKKA
jgi:uncharacterized delta-60 repeat protein